MMGTHIFRQDSRYTRMITKAILLVALALGGNAQRNDVIDNSFQPVYYEDIPPRGQLREDHTQTIPQVARLQPQRQVAHLQPHLQVAQLQPRHQVAHLQPQHQVAHLQPQHQVAHLQPQHQVAHLQPQRQVVHLQPHRQVAAQAIHQQDFRDFDVYANPSDFDLYKQSPLDSYYDTQIPPAEPFVPIDDQYQALDNYGQYAFGFSSGDSSRSETRDAYGNVRGSYNYIDADGNVQTQHYIADDQGFRVIGSNIPKGPGVQPVGVPEAPVLQGPQDTPEVAAAKAAFVKAYNAAAIAAAEAPDEVPETD